MTRGLYHNRTKSWFEKVNLESKWRSEKLKYDAKMQRHFESHNSFRIKPLHISYRYTIALVTRIAIGFDSIASISISFGTRNSKCFMLIRTSEFSIRNMHQCCPVTSETHILFDTAWTMIWSVDSEWFGYLWTKQNAVFKKKKKLRLERTIERVALSKKEELRIERNNQNAAFWKEGS